MDEAAFDVRRRAAHARGCYRPKAIVAIPVRDEADSLIPAILALGAQCDLRGDPLAAGDVLVLVLLNGCTDASWERLQSLRGPDAPSWVAIDGELPDLLKHAGGARRVALAKALALATADTRLIATTDGDSTVSATWVARQLDWMDRGCDVVLGNAELSATDSRALPMELHQRERQERIYAQRLGRIDAWLDPTEYDPWPRHGIPSGASLGFRPAALRSAFPLPAPGCGEDRALVQRCHALDLKVRGDAQLHVTTSARLQGRARGGMADTLLHRLHHPGAPCDATLETVERAVARAQLRARVRERQQSDRLSVRWLSNVLGVPRYTAEDMLALPTFGLLWQACERFSPRLKHVPMSPSLLERELQVANDWLRARATQAHTPTYIDQETVAIELPA